MPTLLIDGYNLIPALPTLGRLARHDLAKARASLLDLLENYRTQAPSRPSIVVVFDGQAGIETRGERGRPGIEVRFSRGETADDLLLRLLRNEKKGAILVTSDRALADAARGLGAEVMRSGEFADRLISRLDSRPEDRESPEDDVMPSFSTRKKGNPKRRPKRARQRARRLRGL
ncbi:MAG: NYN domain-containing protein [Nitrospinota bacterium]